MTQGLGDVDLWVPANALLVIFQQLSNVSRRIRAFPPTRCPQNLAGAFLSMSSASAEAMAFKRNMKSMSNAVCTRAPAGAALRWVYCLRATSRIRDVACGGMIISGAHKSEGMTVWGASHHVHELVLAYSAVFAYEFVEPGRVASRTIRTFG